MLNAALVGAMFGKAVLLLVRGVIWLVEVTAYLAGSAGGLAAKAVQSAWRKGGRGSQG